VVFVLTEFQIVDARTAESNEIGENSHERYKERQIMRVKARLSHGMKEEEERTPQLLDLTGREDGDLGHDYQRHCRGMPGRPNSRPAERGSWVACA
jgi:hypothetical protein